MRIEVSAPRDRRIDVRDRVAIFKAWADEEDDRRALARLAHMLSEGHAISGLIPEEPPPDDAR